MSSSLVLTPFSFKLYMTEIKEFETIISNLREICSSIKNSSKKLQSYENAASIVRHSQTERDNLYSLELNVRYD